MRLGELSWVEMRLGELSWVEMRLGELSWVEVRWGELRWGELRWGEVSWGEVSWGEVIRGKVRWCEVRWNFDPKWALFFGQIWCLVVQKVGFFSLNVYSLKMVASCANTFNMNSDQLLQWKVSSRWHKYLCCIMHE